MIWLAIWVELSLLAGVEIGRVIGCGNPTRSEPEPVAAPPEPKAAPAVRKTTGGLPAVGSFW